MTATPSDSRHFALATPVACVVLTCCFIGATVVAGWWGVPVIAVVWGVWSRTEAAGFRVPGFGFRELQQDPKVKPRVAYGLTAAVCAVVGWAAILAWTAALGPLPLLARTLGTMLSFPGPVLLGLPLVLAGVLAWSATTAARW